MDGYGHTPFWLFTAFKRLLAIDVIMVYFLVNSNHFSTTCLVVLIVPIVINQVSKPTVRCPSVVSK